MHSPQDLLLRVERLERDNRRWKRSFLALGLLLLGATAAGFARPHQTPEEIVAKRFILQDASGEDVGLFGPDRNGNPHLTFRGEAGMALLGVTQPGLLIRHADGKRGSFLGLDGRGGSQLSLTGTEFTNGIKLVVQEEGTSGVYVLNDTGRERVSMEYLSNGNSQFTTRDDDGKVRGFFGHDAGGTSSLVLLDGGGVRRIGALVHPEEGSPDVPVFAVQDSQGRLRSELTLNLDDSATLRMFRQDGKPVFTAP